MSAPKLFIRRAGRVEGPFDGDELRRLHARGRLRAFDEVSEDRLYWKPASSLIDTFGKSPVEAPQLLSPVVAEPQWFYTDAKGNEIGPVSQSQLLAMIDRGSLGKGSEVWRQGMRDWIPLQKSGLVTGLQAPAPAAGSRTTGGIACKVCEQGELRRVSVHRLSGPAIVIGYTLLIPSLAGMALALVLWLIGMLGTAGAANDPGTTGAVGVLLTGYFGCVGLGSFVSGLIGWLLVMRKRILRCDKCGATIEAS